MSIEKTNRTIIIKTETVRSSGVDATFTLGLDDVNATGELQELTFADLCEIDEFLHAYVTMHKMRGGGNE